jgi:hypothetical protein
LWIYGPLLAAPLIPLGVLEAGPVEATAPQALVYGWVLNFAIALIPYVARRLFLKETDPQLGGTWISLAFITLGNLFIWTSIAIAPTRNLLHGVGFAFYVLALIQPLTELARIIQVGMKRFELD